MAGLFSVSLSQSILWWWGIEELGSNQVGTTHMQTVPCCLHGPLSKQDWDKAGRGYSTWWALHVADSFMVWSLSGGAGQVLTSLFWQLYIFTLKFTFFHTTRKKEIKNIYFNQKLLKKERLFLFLYY